MSPRSAKQFDEIRKQKKKLILDTALELICRPMDSMQLQLARLQKKHEYPKV